LLCHHLVQRLQTIADQVVGLLEDGVALDSSVAVAAVAVCVGTSTAAGFVAFFPSTDALVDVSQMSLLLSMHEGWHAGHQLKIEVGDFDEIMWIQVADEVLGGAHVPHVQKAIPLVR